jgi:hypothetical protein
MRHNANSHARLPRARDMERVIIDEEPKAVHLAQEYISAEGTLPHDRMGTMGNLIEIGMNGTPCDAPMLQQDDCVVYD